MQDQREISEIITLEIITWALEQNWSQPPSG
jgi:hypothetical protein